MSQRSFAKWVMPAAVLLGVGLAIFLIPRIWQDEPEAPDNDKSTAGFVEGAEKAGIDFRMRFLPGEQGENFRANLYDHGCGVAIADFDGDGHDDVYFVNQLGPNVLYRNNGDGTFTDVTKQSGLKARGWSGDVVVLDYDDDGRPDLFIASMFGPTQLYHNNGDGTFSDVTKRVLGRTSFGGVGARAFDFNNDGRLDLFLVDMHSDMWMDLDYSHASQ